VIRGACSKHCHERRRSLPSVPITRYIYSQPLQRFTPRHVDITYSFRANALRPPFRPNAFTDVCRRPRAEASVAAMRYADMPSRTQIKFMNPVLPPVHHARHRFPPTNPMKMLSFRYCHAARSAWLSARCRRHATLFFDAILPRLRCCSADAMLRLFFAEAPLLPAAASIASCYRLFRFHYIFMLLLMSIHYPMLMARMRREPAARAR